MANLPYELFYQIALHLPSTKDVLTFTLTHSRVRKALSTPVLFKERLALQGWDVSAWQDEDSNAASGAQSPRGDLGRWMRIDHVYCRTVQLFDEATADDYFSESPPDVPRNPVPGGQKTMVWLRKLSEVLPAFLSHHRGGNVLRITEARHRSALLTYARALYSMCAVVTPRLNICDAPGSQALEPGLAMSEFAWFERASFCLITLLIQCDANTLTSIFSDGVVYTDSPSSTIGSFWATDRDYFIPADLEPYTLSITIAKVRQLRASERYFSTFLIQAMFSLNLRSLDISPPLPGPSLPYINPAASFSYDGPSEPQQGTTPFSIPSPPPRPWLQNKLAGTPLAELLSSADGEGDAGDGGGRRRQWAGYYTVGRQGTDLDPPMFLELYSIPAPTAPPPSNVELDRHECIFFDGGGHDGVGPFTLRGNCHMLTGTVVVTKAYATHLWIWRGMVTPFGMAGTWGPWGLGSANGWWWVWPREWSNDPATTGPD